MTPPVIPELLPCPFCGGTPRISKSGGSDERMGYNFTVSIACGNCHATVNAPSHEDPRGWCDDTGQAERNALGKWNQRAPSTKGALTDEREVCLAAFNAKHPIGDEVPGALRKAFYQLWSDGWQAASVHLTAPPLGDRPPETTDAARYRWLREHPQFLGWEHDFRPDEVDREIDAAIAAGSDGEAR